MEEVVIILFIALVTTAGVLFTPGIGLIPRMRYARKHGERFGLGEVSLSDRVVDRLRAASWPGNVRELENTIERLVALAPEPFVDEDPFADAPARGADDAGARSLKERVAMFERGAIAEALRRCQGNQSEAARQLGVSRVTLIDKIKRLGLKDREV